MSVEAMAVVLHHLPVGGTMKLVALGIANHDGDGGAWPSIKTLAKYACVEPRTVQRALRDLEDLGVISVMVQEGGTSRTPTFERPNLYDLRLKCPANCDGSKNHRTIEDRVTPTSPPDASVTPPLTPTSPPRVTPVSPEPSLEPSLEPSSSSPPVETPDPDTITDELFEKFWSAFPKRVGRARAKAGWEWATKTEGVDPDLLIRQAHGYARLMKKEDRELRYIKTPESWFTARGWEDEYPPAITRDPDWGPDSTAGGW